MILSLLLATASAQPITLVYTGDRLGKVEPCGCPKNPMGHIARHVRYLEERRQKNSDLIAFDLGNYFFESLDIEDNLREQQARRAAILSRSLSKLKLDFMVPGPTDFAAGFEGYKRLLEGVKTPVLAADLLTPSGQPAFATHLVLERHGKRVLIIGIAGFVPAQTTLTRRAPLDAIRRVRAQAGEVDVTIIASHLDRSAGLGLAEKEEGLAAVLIADKHLHLIPKQAGGAVVVGSSKEGKHVAELQLTHHGDGAYAGGMTLRRLKFKLAKATGDEAQKLQAELDRFEAGNLFRYRVDALGEERSEDPEVAGWVKAYVHFVGKLESERGEAPPGYSGEGDFAGFEACATCHADIVATWRATRHAIAYQSLYDRGQHLDRECIGCHTAGWRHPGGFSDPRAVGILKNVQCESCHGPGKEHAKTGDKRLIERGQGNAAFCERCHQKELETGFDEATHIPMVKHW